MKICEAHRGVFYQLMSVVFQAFKIKPTIAELGVLRGENAMAMYQAMSPEHMVLIDSWSPDANAAYSPFQNLPPWVSPIDTFAYYYGGPMDEQSTWDRLYEECVNRFSEIDNVSIIRAGTIDAIDHIKPGTGISQFDLIYIDANHQYEYILRDLMYYQNLLGPEGAMLLNDCCFSQAGTMQNLGVLEALGNFIKRSDFIPVAMTNTDFSDVILVRKGSKMETAIDFTLRNSDVGYVEVPHQLITAARVVNGPKRTNISFC